MCLIYRGYGKMTIHLLKDALLKNKPNLSRGSLRTYLSGFKILSEKIINMLVVF